MATPTELHHQDGPRTPSTGMHVRPAPAGARPAAWQLVLWRFLALVAHLMRPSTADARSNTELYRYLRRHPLRGAAYAVAAWTAAVLPFVLVTLPAMLLLERLHLRPRGAADFGVTVLAVCGLLALWFAVGRWLRHVVAARVDRWRTGRPLER
jgi:hypothetical protein